MGRLGLDAHNLAEVDDSGISSVAVCGCGASWIGVGPDRVSEARAEWSQHALRAARVAWQVNPYRGWPVLDEYGNVVAESVYSDGEPPPPLETRPLCLAPECHHHVGAVAKADGSGWRMRDWCDFHSRTKNRNTVRPRYQRRVTAPRRNADRVRWEKRQAS